METEKNFLENHGGTRQGYPILPFLLTIELDVLTKPLNQEERMKGLKIGNKEVMLSLFGVDVYCTKGEPKYLTRRLLKLMNKSRKPAVHKINLQKSVNGAGKWAQWVKALAAKSEDFSFSQIIL